MKKAYILALALFSVLSCGKQEVLPEAEPEWTDLTVSIEGRKVVTSTKAIMDGDAESNIESVQILAFHEDGTLDAYSKGNGSAITLKCTVGEREIYAVVNSGEDLSSVKTRDELLGKQTLLDDNSLRSFVMIGSGKVTLPCESLVIKVDRVVSRVVLRKVTNGLLDAFASNSIEITGAYLINVAGDRVELFGGESGVKTWLSRMRHEDHPTKGLTYESVGQSLVHGKSDVNVRAFYACPNLTVGDAHLGAWTPRHTRLVVETRIMGNTYYYPMTLPVIRSNHSYEIKELIIRRLGAANPDEALDPAAASFEVEIADWTYVKVTGPDDTEEGHWTI